MNNNQMPNSFQQPVMYNNQKPKKTKGCLITVLVVVLALVVIGIVIFFAVFANSKKLVCKSKEGEITILYNRKTIVGYTAKGMKYDLEGQKEYAKSIGIDAYLDEFSTWFNNNTTGQCSR